MQVVQRLQAELELPWEGALTEDVERSLGAFKRPVLQLLQRDPSTRASLRAFHNSCVTLFSARMSK